MLIKFRARNFKSFRDDLELDMRALNIRGNNDNVIDNFKILKSAVIFGANAAGKSNIVNAVKAMCSTVLFSSKAQRGDNVIGVTPFLLNKDSKNKPTEFEIEFSIDDDIKTRYIYGFIATDKTVLKEWLYSYPNNTKRIVFKREFNYSQQIYDWDNNNGKYLDVKNDDIAMYRKMTRDNELFLSKIVQLNNKSGAACVFDWFNKKLKYTGISGWSDGDIMATDMIMKDGKKKDILDFLNQFDLNITDIVIKEEKIPEGLNYITEAVKSHLLSQLPGVIATKEELKSVTTSLVRKINGNDFGLNINNESDGTKKIYSLAAPFLSALRDGATLIIDELNNSLHPMILKRMVEIFHDRKINKNNAQLIFTTHDAVLLDQNLFRRDQVYFCSKDDDCASYLDRLSDYKIREKEKTLKGYLLGRYGGIPNLNNFFIGYL